MSLPETFHRAGPDGVTLTIRVTPKAPVSAIAGVVGLPDGRQALGVRVAAPPVDGAANAALLDVLRKRLRVGRTDLTLLAGGSSRLKAVHVRGDPAGIVARLTSLLA